MSTEARTRRRLQSAKRESRPSDASQAPATRREMVRCARNTRRPRGGLRRGGITRAPALVHVYTQPWSSPRLVLLSDMAPSKTKTRAAQSQSSGAAWTTKWLVRFVWATAVWAVYRGLDAIKVSRQTSILTAHSLSVTTNAMLT